MVAVVVLVPILAPHLIVLLVEINVIVMSNAVVADVKISIPMNLIVVPVVSLVQVMKFVVEVFVSIL